jgi:hypothetical protein
MVLLKDIIIIKVQNGVLRVYSTHRIKRFKELVVTIYGPSLEGIELRNDAQIESKGLLESSILHIASFDNSQFDLDLEVTNLSVDMNDRSKGKISNRSETVDITMVDRSDMKADISTTNLSVVLEDNADLKIKGDSNTASYLLNDAVNMKAQDMKVREVVMNATNNADVFLHASKDLQIFAKGKSTIYLYGQPTIDVKGLGDQAKLIKKN